MSYNSTFSIIARTIQHFNFETTLAHLKTVKDYNEKTSAPTIIFLFQVGLSNGILVLIRQRH